MKPILIAGVVIVHLALLSYTIAIVFLHRHKVLSKNVTTFLILGVLFDIISTICMVIGSGHVLTLHGIIGYTSLAGMLTDTIVSLLLVRKYGSGIAVSPKFLRWSTMAYGYWIVAYFTGAIIVILR
jgi:hypothetical protein